MATKQMDATTKIFAPIYTFTTKTITFETQNIISNNMAKKIKDTLQELEKRKHEFEILSAHYSAEANKMKIGIANINKKISDLREAEFKAFHQELGIDVPLESAKKAFNLLHKKKEV